jgi:hypothetical protein
MALSAAGYVPNTASIASALAGTSTSTAIGLEAPILAITAAGNDPRNFNGNNYLSDLESFYSTSTNDLGGGTAVNDDIFGLLALSSAGVTSTNPVFAGTRSFLIANQDSDGGWPYAVGAGSDSNDTAAALMALMATGSKVSDSVILNGLSYLKGIQNPDGGFTYDPAYGTSTDASSDSWVISAIYAAGESPTSTAWTEGTSTPISSLDSMQDPSGFFEYQPGYTAADSYDTTSYAVIASLGKYLPVGTISAPTSTPLAVVVTPANIPNATVGSPYSETITATDTSASDTFAWTIATNTLPADFTVSTSTSGISITGTPSVSGTYALAVAAVSNSVPTSSSTLAYALTVEPAPTAGSSSGPSGGAQTPSSVQVSYQIEGPSGEMCSGTGPATTAIDVLVDASSLCNLSYSVRQYSFGPYVYQIGSVSASGASGWLYTVDSVMPSVGANDYDVKANDKVVWYFGNGTGSSSTPSAPAPSLISPPADSSATEATIIPVAPTGITSSTPSTDTGKSLGASTTSPTMTLAGLEKELVSLEFKVNGCSFVFNKNLYQGIDDTDVQNLQTALDYSPMTEVSSMGSGSPGNETNYFGRATKDAVISFQDIFADDILSPSGMASGNGYVGPSTRTVLNNLCSGK